MKFLSYGVMVYMLMALVWWTILLSRNNNVIYQKNKALISLIKENNQDIKEIDGIESDLARIEKDFKRNKYMIIGEGMVFGISLIFGLWLIQKSYNKELENTTRQKNFLLSITHELKSPIASINLITQTLLKRKLEPDKVADLQQGILSESTRLEKLINNLLLATRVDNAYQYHFENCDIKDIIQNVAQKISLQYPEATLHQNLPSEAIHLDGDQEAIISLVTNVLENGIKYSNPPANIYIDLVSQNNSITLTVKDEGYGIPEKEKPKVIQQFYRIGNEDTRKTKGTGLGLFIVNKIIKGHKGKLDIQDNEPKGTKIIITLPKKQ